MKSRQILAGAFLVAGFSTGVSADSLTVTKTNGSLNQTDAITGFATDGDGMVGMTVTAFFNDGSSQAVGWQATSTIAGVAQGTGWSLSESGDTFGGDWVFTNVNALPITRFLLDGGTGRTVFDVNPSSPDTPNSAGGLAFTLRGGGTNRDISVDYRDIVALTGNAAIGDLFRRMDVVFGVPGGPILPGSPSLVFETDTDNATTDVVPEPAAGIIALAGLFVQAPRRWRRGMDGPLRR